MINSRDDVVAHDHLIGMILPVAVAKIIIIDVVGESVVEVIQWEIMMKIIIAPLVIIIITIIIIEDIIMITGEVAAGGGDIAVVATDMTMTLIITATTSMDGTEGGHLVERRPTLPSHMPQNPCFVNSFGRRNSKRMTGRNVCKRRRQRRRKMVMST
jgi:hypothetical protein